MSEVGEFDYIFGFLNSLFQGTSLLEWVIAFLIFNIIATAPKGEMSKNLSEMADLSMKEKISWFDYVKSFPSNLMSVLLLVIVIFIIIFGSGVLLYLPLLLIEFIFNTKVISNGFNNVAIVLGFAISIVLIAKK